MNIPSVADILSDPASSYWLKYAVVEAHKRDVVDALHDAELLAAILKRRLDKIRTAA